MGVVKWGGVQSIGNGDVKKHVICYNKVTKAGKSQLLGGR